MHLLLSILVGTAVGILMTVPLGPISIYVAQQTLGGDSRRGVWIALGSVIIDVFYCLVITLGLFSLIGSVLQHVWVQFALSVFLILYGLKMLFFDGRGASPKPEQLRQPAAMRRGTGHLSVLLGTVMALSNPTLFLSWTAVIGFVSAHSLLSSGFFDKVIFSFASGFGSFLWFIGLILFVRSRRHTLSPKSVRIAGAITALVVIGFGVYFSITVIRHLGGLA